MCKDLAASCALLLKALTLQLQCIQLEIFMRNYKWWHVCTEDLHGQAEIQHCTWRSIPGKQNALGIVTEQNFQEGQASLRSHGTLYENALDRQILGFFLFDKKTAKSVVWLQLWKWTYSSSTSVCLCLACARCSCSTHKPPEVPSGQGSQGWALHALPIAGCSTDPVNRLRRRFAGSRRWHPAGRTCHLCLACTLWP